MWQALAESVRTLQDERVNREAAAPAGGSSPLVGLDLAALLAAAKTVRCTTSIVRCVWRHRH